MTPDYDLSELPAGQADLWMFLQAGAIRSQLMAEQADRPGFPCALGNGAVFAMKEKPQAPFNNS